MLNHLHAILWIVALKGVGAELVPARDGSDLSLADGHLQGASLRIDENIHSVGAGIAHAHGGRDVLLAGGYPRGAHLRCSTLGDILGADKSMVVNQCLKVYKARNKQMGEMW